MIVDPPQSIDRHMHRPRATSSSSDMSRLPADDLCQIDGHTGGSRSYSSTMRLSIQDARTRREDPFHPSTFLEPTDPDDRPPSRTASESFPAWLKGAISSLDPKHPLKLLVQDQAPPHRQSSPSDLNPSSDMSSTHEQESFALVFRAPSTTSTADLPMKDFHGSPTAYYLSASSTAKLQKSSWHALPYTAEAATVNNHVSELSPPFSLPGPASTISLPSPDFDLTANILSRQTRRHGLRDTDGGTPLFDFQSLTAPSCALSDIGRSSSTSPERFGSSPWQHLPSMALPQPESNARQPIHGTSPMLSHSHIPLTPGSPSRSLSAHQDISVHSKRFLSDIGSPEAVEHASPDREIDHSALGFKWEKFDRGDIIFDASSPSLGHSLELDSEAAFWSQSAPHTPHQDDVVCPSLPGISSHAASSPVPVTPPRATISSGRRTNPLTQATPHFQPISDKESRPHGENPEDQFIWIVPPKDEPVPSLRFQRITDTAPSTPEELSGQQKNRETKDEAVAQRPSVSAKPSFAPAPGICISPLGATSDPPQDIHDSPKSFGSANSFKPEKASIKVAFLRSSVVDV